MLHEAENRVRIEGLLSETDLKYGSFVKNGETIETIGGTIKVLVEQVVNAVPLHLEIPVHLFSQKYKKDGGLNPSYESIQRVKEEFMSIASAGGREGADKIRITGAKIKMNEFFSKDGRFVSSPRITASFVGKATGDFKPEASFSLTFAVSNINYVVDKNGIEVEPKKLEITAIVPNWNKQVEVVKLYASNPNVINAITQYWEPDYTFKANGRLNFTSTTETYIEDVDFGEAIEKTRTRSISELLITGGSQSALEGEQAFDVEDLAQAMKERKARLEAQKAKDMNKVKGEMKTPAPTTSRLAGDDMGF